MFTAKTRITIAFALALGVGLANDPHNQSCSPGPQGPQGVQGPAGPRGADGAKGSQGVAGPQGVQGLQGSSGIGVQGPQGVSGPQGTQGPAGKNGDPASPFFRYQDGFLNLLLIQQAEITAPATIGGPTTVVVIYANSRQFTLTGGDANRLIGRLQGLATL